MVSSSGLPMAVPPREGSLAHGGTRRSRPSVLQSRGVPPTCVLAHHASRHTARRRRPSHWTSFRSGTCGIYRARPRFVRGRCRLNHSGCTAHSRRDRAAQRAWVIEGAAPEEQVALREGFRTRANNSEPRSRQTLIVPKKPHGRAMATVWPAMIPGRS